MLAQRGYPINQGLITSRLIIRTVGQLLIQTIDGLLQLTDMIKSGLGLLTHGSRIGQGHLLRQIANRHLLWFTDRTRCRRL